MAGSRFASTRRGAGPATAGGDRRLAAAAVPAVDRRRAGRGDARGRRAARHRRGPTQLVRPPRRRRRDPSRVRRRPYTVAAGTIVDRRSMPACCGAAAAHAAGRLAARSSSTTPAPPPLDAQSRLTRDRSCGMTRTVGPAGARNTGLAEVTTPFVAFVDTDVELTDGLAATAARPLRRPDGWRWSRHGSPVAPGDGCAGARTRRGTARSTSATSRRGSRPAPASATCPPRRIVCRVDALRARRRLRRVAALRRGRRPRVAARRRPGHRCRYEPAVGRAPRAAAHVAGAGSPARSATAGRPRRSPPPPGRARAGADERLERARLVARSRCGGRSPARRGRAAPRWRSCASSTTSRRANRLRLAAARPPRRRTSAREATVRVWWPLALVGSVAVVAALPRWARSPSSRSPHVVAASAPWRRSSTRRLVLADELAYGAGVWRGVIARTDGGAAACPTFSDWPRRGRRADVVARLAHVAGIDAPAHQPAEHRAAEAEREHRLQRGRDHQPGDRARA